MLESESKGSKHKLIMDSTKILFSNIILRISQIIQGIFVANILGPVLFGLKNAVQLISDYGNYAHLGVLNSFNKKRQLLEYSNITERDHITNITFSYIVLVSLIFAVVCIFLFFLLNVSSVVRYSILIIGFLVPTALFISFVTTIFQSRDDFKELSSFNIFQGVFVLLSLVLFVYLFGMPGYFLGSLTGSLLVLVFFWNAAKYKPKFVLKFDILWILIKSGFSLFLFSLAYLVFFSVDRIFIIYYFGELQLGLYAVGLFFANLIYFFISTLLQPVVPQIYQNINNKLKLSNIIIKPSKVIYILIYWFVFMILFLFPFVIFIMPKYASGLNFIYILVFSIMFYPVLVVNYFIGKNRELQLILHTVIFLVLAIILNFIVIVLGLSAIYIAVATALAIFLYGNSLNYFGYKDLLGSGKLAVKEIWNYLLPLIYALFGFGLLFLFAKYLLYDIINYYIVKIIQAVLFTIWYLPILWKIEKEYGIIKMIWQGIKNKFKKSNLDKSSLE